MPIYKKGIAHDVLEAYKFGEAQLDEIK